MDRLSCIQQVLLVKSLKRADLGCKIEWYVHLPLVEGVGGEEEGAEAERDGEGAGAERDGEGAEAERGRLQMVWMEKELKPDAESASMAQWLRSQESPQRPVQLYLATPMASARIQEAFTSAMLQGAVLCLHNMELASEAVLDAVVALVSDSTLQSFGNPLYWHPRYKLCLFYHAPLKALQPQHRYLLLNSDKEYLRNVSANLQADQPHEHHPYLNALSQLHLYLVHYSKMFGTCLT